MPGLEPPSPPSASSSDRPLDFEKADFDETPSEVTCSSTSCCRTIRDRYYQVNGLVLCEACTTAARQERDAGSGPSRFLRALALGTLAGAAGAAIWYGIRVATHLEIGLIAIAVGLLVGVAVRKGSRGRGGWRYQALAMAITYASICSTYVPDILSSFRESAQKAKTLTTAAPGATSPSSATGGAVRPGARTEAPPTDAARTADPPRIGIGKAAFAWLFILGLALALPFLMGFQNILGILIIGFGVYEAWKINRRTSFDVLGPFSVSRRAFPDASPRETSATPSEPAAPPPPDGLAPIKPS